MSYLEKACIPMSPQEKDDYKKKTSFNKNNDKKTIRPIKFLSSELTLHNLQEGFIFIKGLIRYCTFEEARVLYAIEKNSNDIFKYDLSNNNTSKVEKLRPINIEKEIKKGGDNIYKYIQEILDNDLNKIETIKFMNFKYFTSNQDSAISAYYTCIYKNLFVETNSRYENLIKNNINFNVNMELFDKPMLHHLMVLGDKRMQDKVTKILRNKPYEIEALNLDVGCETKDEFKNNIKKIPLDFREKCKNYKDTIFKINFSKLHSNVLRTLLDNNVLKYYLSQCSNLFEQLSERDNIEDKELIKSILILYLNTDSFFVKNDKNIYIHQENIKDQFLTLESRKLNIKDQYDVNKDYPKHIKEVFADILTHSF